MVQPLWNDKRITDAVEKQYLNGVIQGGFSAIKLLTQMRDEYEAQIVELQKQLATPQPPPPPAH